MLAKIITGAVTMVMAVVAATLMAVIWAVVTSKLHEEQRWINVE
jgi:Na+-translocating ferredoxin:NAD+ oxidoreductase RnfG subunit